MREERLWQTVLGDVEITLSRGNYLTWFKNTRLIKISGGTAVIGVVNIFIKNHLGTKYRDLIISTLEKNGTTVKSLEFKIQNNLAAKHSEELDGPTLGKQPIKTPNQAVLPPTSIPTAQPLSGVGQSYRQGLNEKYTFENFVVGSGNELAYAACQAVAAQPGTKYNPLFLYGGVGIGKTHLIEAVGNEVKRHNPEAKVVYITSEQFVQEFVDALRFKKAGDFASHYRTTDVLIVDDIQFFAGKEKIQEEFFHTFNALHQANKQMIISSDKPPGDIPTLEERLRSRFVWGMSIDMQNPDFETRCAIIQTKAESLRQHLPHDVVEYLATNIATNIRELEGALNQVVAFCEMRGLEPNLPIVTGMLGSNRNRPKHLSAKQIVDKCARYYQVPLEDLLSPKRDKDIVLPRQVAMYLLRSELHLSFPKIANELGRKDHTTAIHSIEKIEKEQLVDQHVRMALANIKEQLYA
ncbi:MAG: chromosomal replication initiator protein [Patescibacteria group bacterium]|nr:chromosomal replication initiator protein [Patescibacteria group bacterium]